MNLATKASIRILNQHKI